MASLVNPLVALPPLIEKLEESQSVFGFASYGRATPLFSSLSSTLNCIVRGAFGRIYYPPPPGRHVPPPCAAGRMCTLHEGAWEPGVFLHHARGTCRPSSPAAMEGSMVSFLCRE